MNSVILIGRLTADPVVRYTQSQLPVCRFNIAINRGKDKNGADKGADFPTINAFGKTAENITRYSGKGLRVCVTGRITTGKYTNKNGEIVYTTEVTADKVEFIDWKENNAQNGAQGVTGYNQANTYQEQQANMYPPAGFETVDDDDLPF